MANNTRDLRRRIRSVKNTAQLTRAMKMVSAAKLRRAQEAMTAARPYAFSLRKVLADVARRAPSDLHPLLRVRPEKNVDLIVITGDKGLCGAFNANVLKAAERWRLEREARGVRVHLTLIGRKGAEYYRRRPQVAVRETLTDVTRTLNYMLARGIADRVEERYIGADSDGAYIAVNEFKSVGSQQVVVLPLLPLHALNGDKSDAVAATEYIFEPSAEGLLAALLPRYTSFEVYEALLESIAAEHAARMSSMDNATRNAKEMIDTLTLEMNRVRQAAITKEIIEVVSGADALG